ncbi:MAG: 6-phosphofructokinase [Spirochaetales bacterium]|jgi:6-phosphofructokinase 1|nr:6-phosphofructokinase [Exilispira sp.]NMC67010.1 6-phosphofructokinase [Spirochaetales bacterium]
MNIAVLSAGGDSPGINAFIRSLYYFCAKRGHTLYGVYRGWEGLIHGEYTLLTESDVKNIAFTGGSILKNSKFNPLKNEENVIKIKLWISQLSIDQIIVIGSFDTHRIALQLSNAGIPLITIPQTIDNDINGTDFSLGFYSSVKNIVSAIETIRTTNESHERDILIETMGRKAGWLTVFSAMTTKVEGFFIPEMGIIDIDDMIKLFSTRREKGYLDNIILIAEGVECKGIKRELDDDEIYSEAELTGITFTISDLISQKGYRKPKVVILSYIQRGGTPDVYDVVLADRLAFEAIKLCEKDVHGVTIGCENGKVYSYPISNAINQRRLVNKYYIDLASMLLD